MADSIDHDGRANRATAHTYQPKDDKPFAPCAVCQAGPPAPQHITVTDERENQ